MYIVKAVGNQVDNLACRIGNTCLLERLRLIRKLLHHRTELRRQLRAAELADADNLLSVRHRHNARHNRHVDACTQQTEHIIIQNRVIEEHLRHEEVHACINLVLGVFNILLQRAGFRMSLGISSAAHAEIALLLDKAHQIAGMSKAALMVALHISWNVAAQCENIIHAMTLQLLQHLGNFYLVCLHAGQMRQRRQAVILHLLRQGRRIADGAAACAISDAHIGRLDCGNPVNNLQTVLQLCALLRRKQLTGQVNASII